MAVENIVWPRYLNASITRSDGRRVSLQDAIEDPEVDEIAEAVQQIGYDAVIEHDVAHPREWGTSGRVIVKGADDSSKNDLVQAVAAYIHLLRE